MATASGELAERLRPARLRERVRLRHDRPGRLEIADDTVAIEVEDPRLTAESIGALARTRDPAAVGTGGTDRDFVDGLTAALADNGLLVDDRVQDAVVASRDAERFTLAWLDRWVDDIYYDGLWDPLLERPGSANLFYGWAVENYHYTRSVDEHLGTTVGYARRMPVERKFVEHLSQEWDHPHLFLDSARVFSRSRGIDEPVERSRPLAGTRAVGGHLRDAAKRHPFVYKTCAAVLERTASRVQETRDFYARICDVQAIPPEAVAPIVLHAETDEDYEHLNSLAEFRDIHRTIASEVLAEALTRARAFVDLLHLWQRQIADRYGRFEEGRGAFF